MKQKIVRIYPHGWTNTNDRINQLNELLEDGWFVKHITVMGFNETQHSDYILEKTDSNK